MKIVLKIVLISSLFMLVFAGCGLSKEESEKIKTNAEPLAENVLKSINNKDLDSFSKDFDDKMNSAFTKDSFKSLYEMLDTKVGTYKSKELVKVQKTKGDYVLIYKAKYDKEPKDVVVTLSLSEKNGKYLVSGLYFNSPNLKK